MQNSVDNRISAILYTRVSTEEQAVRGGSLKTQEDTLRQYCLLRNIKIEKVFIEDHSAKTFNRPEWKKLFAEIRNSIPPPDLLLFTRWDRFSRNTGDAYYTIKTLKKFGVDPQAVEQPLDLSVPENKMMLAFYLAIPEVENDRRGLNTKMGIQRAKERGRVIGPAPLGYVNHCYADGSKTILRKEPEASIMNHAFEQLENVQGKIIEVYREASMAGLKCSYGNFWKLLQNPVYAGNIKITELDKGVSYLIPGLHKGIVSEATFNKVQTLLFNKNKRKQNINGTNPFTPLRGFLSCPRCSRILYASGSTGRAAIRYYYYHCTSECGYRVRAEKINELFAQKIAGLTITKTYIDLYQNIVSDKYAKEIRRLFKRKMRALNSIEEFTERVAKAKNLLLDSHIEYKEYTEIKSDLETKIRLLSYSIDAHTNKQTELSNKIQKEASFLTQPANFLEKLHEKNKPEFFNAFLKRGQNWESVDSNHIFQDAVCLTYGLISTVEPVSKSIQPELLSFLQTMASLELSLNE